MFVAWSVRRVPNAAVPASDWRLLHPLLYKRTKGLVSTFLGVQKNVLAVAGLWACVLEDLVSLACLWSLKGADGGGCCIRCCTRAPRDW
jgi:hypothetical protein